MMIYDSSYFQIDGEFYMQMDGSTMGNSASLSLVGFIMNDLICDSLRLSFGVALIRLYVDDAILAFPEDKVTEVLTIFND